MVSFYKQMVNYFKATNPVKYDKTTYFINKW